MEIAANRRFVHLEYRVHIGATIGIRILRPPALSVQQGITPFANGLASSNRSGKSRNNKSSSSMAASKRPASSRWQAWIRMYCALFPPGRIRFNRAKKSIWSPADHAACRNQSSRIIGNLPRIHQLRITSFRSASSNANRQTPFPASNNLPESAWGWFLYVRFFRPWG